MKFQDFLITEPSTDMPSITRGVGRKTSLENEHKVAPPTIIACQTVKIEPDQYARRGSDKSLGFSDDSLSNDSNHSPAQEVSASSGFKSNEDGRLSPDSLSESRGSTDEYYEFPLPNECSNLDTTSILELVKKQINSKMPPNGLVVGKSENQADASNSSQLPVDMSNLSLEYSGGLQIEVQVCDHHHKDQTNGGKGIKLRRISGDQSDYNKLCKQLLNSSLTAV